MAAFIGTVQVVAVPEQSPDQPAKDDPALEAAVRVTEVPEEQDSEQSLPQLIPAGLLVTVPVPDPAFATVRA